MTPPRSYRPNLLRSDPRRLQRKCTRTSGKLKEEKRPPVFVAIVLATSFLLSAAATAAPLKIGFVDIQNVLQRSPQAEAARDRIEREFAPRDQTLLARRRELKALEDKLIRNRAVLSSAELRRQEAEIRSRKRELRRLRDWYHEDLNRRRSEEFGKLQNRVMTVIKRVAESEDYDLVLTDGIIYASDVVNISRTVMRRLDAESGKPES